MKLQMQSPSDDFILTLKPQAQRKSVIRSVILFLGLFSYLQISSQCDPSAPSYDDPSSQDGILELMNIPCAWTLSNGNPNIIVAIGDLYLDDAHTDLTGKVILPINGDCDPEDALDNHGLMCFGAVAGIRNNDWCIAGSGGLTRVAGWCKGLSISQLDEVYEAGYKIVSISRFDAYPRSQMEKVTENGVVVLIAGLNTAHQNFHDVPGVIHVGRATQDKQFWNYTNNNTTNINLDVLTVTEELHRVSRVNTCEQSQGGTSIGTPLLAGVVALMRDVNPCLSPADIEEILVETADDIPSNATSANTRAGVINAYEAVLAAQNFVGEDQTWGAGGGGSTVNNAYVSGDLDIFSGGNVVVQGNVYFGSESVVTIQPNAKLIVEGSLNLGENSTIIVKRGGHLIVDGGKLTRSWCAESWKGIIVEGNTTEPQQLPASSLYADQCGIVEIVDGGIIEYAIIAVSMRPTHLEWPFNEYYGGLLIAENATFQFNIRAVEFMQYRKFEDNSKFTNVSFVGNGKFLTTHWENHGVIYDNCDFSNYEHQAIMTWDAAINVINGCEFDNALLTQNDQASMHLYHTTSNPYASVIGDVNTDPNKFFGGYNNVFATGAGNTDPTLIRNNIFVGGRSGVQMSGIAHHTIEHNDFFGQNFGNMIVANGDNINTSADNNFSDIDVSIYSWYDNQQFRFLSNCFLSVDRDYKQFAGKIADDIGSPSLAAGNCFTINLGFEHIDLVSGAQPFNYHIWQNTPSFSCRRPRMKINGTPSIQYLFVDAAQEPTLNCGSSETAGPITLPPVPCNIPADPEDIEDFIDDLEDEISDLNIQLQNTSYPSAQWFLLKYEITELKECLQLANLRDIRARALENELSELISFFQNKSFYYKTHVFGAIVHNLDYTLARTYLDSMSASNEEETDYKFIQGINLDRLESKDYVLTATDSTQLRTKSLTTFPYAGYGRSLFYILTGEHLLLELPGFDEVEPRSSKPYTVTELRITVYPNPVTDEITIETSLPCNDELVVSLFNVHGQNITGGLIPKGLYATHVRMADVGPGVYFLTIKEKSGGKIVFQDKLIKQ